MIRVGSGIDVHAFGPGDHVMLGGVRLAHTQGVRAHSDGDVLLHALCDALLGAAGLGDIGQHFPDSDPQWRGAASGQFVRHAVQLLAARGWQVVNADLTLLAEAPRVAGQRELIRASVAGLLGVAAEAVNLKATTTERLGFAGRGEGLAAMATVLIESNSVAPRSSAGRSWRSTRREGSSLLRAEHGCASGSKISRSTKYWASSPQDKVSTGYCACANATPIAVGWPQTLRARRASGRSRWAMRV